MPLGLVPRFLLSHPVRSLLTLASIVVAVFLVALLRTIVVSLDAGVQAASANRLVVQSAVSLFVNLPQSYQPRIESVEGVEVVAKWQWFGGIYQDPSQFFAQFGVDADHLLDLYPELRVVEGWVRAASHRLPSPAPDAIVPVPLHGRRLRERGFNPAARLARAVAREIDAPLDASVLVRVRDTPSQTGLDRRARRANVEDAFACRGLVPARVWLVDDVVTTGATLSACAKVLRRGGAEQVAAICAAWTPPHRSLAAPGPNAHIPIEPDWRMPWPG